MALHPVRVVKIAEIKPHSNADNLEIVPIPGTLWQCVTIKDKFHVGDLAVYVEPDMVVPTDQVAFGWLAKEGSTTHRLKSVRLRGELSFGLIIPAPSMYALDSPNGPEPQVTKEGDDLAQLYGIVRYEPTVMEAGHDGLRGPWPTAPIFDVESLANYPNVLEDQEMVIVTEKIHGTGARYLFQDGIFYMGSRTRWLDPTATHFWSLAAAASKAVPTDEQHIDPDGEADNDQEYGVEAWCRAHEGSVLYGEIYGPVASLKYGATVPTFRCFTAWEAPDSWFMPLDLQTHNVKTVPLVYVGPWNQERVLKYAETNTDIPGAEIGHMMEGVVIQPVVGRRDADLGRVILKFISNRYWEAK